MTKLEGKYKNLSYSLLSKYIYSLTESYIDSKTANGDPAFLKYGLTDTAILLLIKRSGLLLITDDFPLAGLVYKRGYDVINFNHIREHVLRHGS